MAGTVLVEALGAQGDGVRADGGYLPFTLPGETVRRADGAVLAPSPDRVAPGCPHFGRCGGCALQHASDGFIAGWKRDLVARALAARGIEGAEIAPVVTVPPASRRRAVFAARRTRSGAVVGLRTRAGHEIVPVPGCLVVTPAIRALMPVLGGLVEAGLGRRGEARLAVTDYPQGPEVVAEGMRPADGPLAARLAGLARAAGLSRLVWADETVVSLAAPAEPMGRARVRPPPGAFLQPTRAGAAMLAEAVSARLAGARRVADLFSGCGTLALPLAGHADVHAVEGDGAALAALDAGWRAAPGLRRVTTERRDLFRRPLMAAELARFDAVSLDPPRQGARAQVAALAQAGVARIAMVSCNPATFARDARTLIDSGYRLGAVQPVDQFRWSPHLELVAGLARS